MKRSRALAIEVTSRAPTKLTPSRKFAPLLLARKLPLPLTLMTPVMRTPFCTTALPAPATIWLPALARMWVDSSKVPPPTACKVPALTKDEPPPLAGVAMLSVPPATSAEIRPWLVSTLLPPTSTAVPMLPWPRTVTPAPSVVLPVPSTDSLALASFKLITAAPPRVWAPPAVALLSRLRMPPFAICTAPLKVAPLTMRSREMAIDVRSSVPLKATPSRKLLPLLLALKTPLPLELMTPVMRTPPCTTALPVPARIWLPGLAVIAVASSSVAPFTACRVPLLTKTEPPPLAGGVMLSVAPVTSAEIRPLLVKVLLPPTSTAVPMLPWPRTVRPAASVVLPDPSTARRAPGSLRLMTPDPAIVWAPPAVALLSRLRMPPPAMFTCPLTVAPLTTRLRALAMLVMSSTPFSVTPLRKFALLLLDRKRPLPLVTKVPPCTMMPVCTTVLPFSAEIWPALLSMKDASCRLPPARASSTPWFVTLLLPPLAGVERLKVPPAISAEIRPRFTNSLLPPANSGVPTSPCPRTRILAPSVVVPLPSMARRAPLSLRWKVPVPLMLLAAASVLSRLRMPPLPMFTAPFSTMPAPMRSRALTLVATSSTPFKATLLSTLLLLLKATTAPLPSVLTVPPARPLPNRLSTLPLATLITPPALLIWCPLPTCSAAVTGPPTRMVPVLVVLPPLCRLRPKASSTSVPPWFRV